MLLQIRDFIQREQVASTQQLAREFHIDEKALQPMLDIWVNKGVIKNDSVRRQILKDFELWARQYFVIVDKADSDVAGAKGNRERFYLLQKTA